MLLVAAAAVESAAEGGGSKMILLVNLLFLVSTLGVWLLWRHSSRTLLLLILVTSFVECARFFSAGNWSFEAWSALLKLLCEWPLGLGSLVSFGLLPEHLQKTHIRKFTIYVNTAVLGNIAMMFFVPAAGTLRGQTHRAVCVILVSWLVMEMRKERWQTVRYRDGLFIFTASPLSWVLCHAFYRLGMITLPAFDTARYLIMEPASLGLMLLLSSSYGSSNSNKERSSDVSLWFGLADTVVVSTITCVSTALTTVLNLPTSLSTLPASQTEKEEREAMLDAIFTKVHLIVGVIALAFLVNILPRPHSGGRHCQRTYLSHDAQEDVRKAMSATQLKED